MSEIPRAGTYALKRARVEIFAGPLTQKVMIGLKLLENPHE